MQEKGHFPCIMQGSCKIPLYPARISARSSVQDFARIVCVGRHASDKRSLLDTVIADILDALEKLDVDDSIPLIFCEASDLLKLPSLLTSNFPVTDTKRDGVLSSLKSLSEELQGKLSRSDGVADRLKQKLDTVQADMKSLESVVTSAITSLSSDLPSFSKEASKLGSISSSQHVASVRSPLGNSHACVSSSMNRSMNIALFGVLEQSLFETRKSVDEMFSFLCGSPVPIRDLFRLGKFVEGRTGPVLVKLLNFWDKRIILASKTKLKTFRISKVFIRPDLSPDERANHRAKFAGNCDQGLSTATPVSNPPIL